MADGYWNRQQASLLPSGGIHKRPRSDYDLPPSGMLSRHDMHNYLSRDDDRGEPQPLKDTSTIGSAYDRYLQSAQYSSFTSGEASTFAGDRLERSVAGGLGCLPADPGVTGRAGAIGADLVPNGRRSSYHDQLPVDSVARPGRDILPLPPEATSTLYVEGLPPGSTRREVAHIFRPFVGYKEVRLVIKESKQRGGDPLILCFVDFDDPACAATAMSALQGYKMDEDDPDSKFLRLQFARNPGPRSGPGIRGRR
ncbi:RNA-binding protein like [Melia azedarach]|uniref:RNA-binding protein like n=1 Tax=Melia azedarach TaxID=155640 RepID=A0ACC1WRJ3_MELAZ|nr:RNA-binding protein like [Melia azedarach]